MTQGAVATRACAPMWAGRPTPRRAPVAPGLGLIELLIGLAIVAILSGLAHAAYSHARARVALADTRALVYFAAETASRHAVLHRQRVVWCPQAGGALCADTADWSKGWLVYADRNRNGELDAGEPLLLSQVLSPDVSVTTTAGRQRLIFASNGTAPGSNVTFSLCHRSQRSRPLTVVLAGSGRIRRGDAPASCP